MICPNCGKQIEKVVIVSLADQYGTLVEKDGYVQVKDIQSVHYIGETQSYECPECFEAIIGIEFREVF